MKRWRRDRFRRVAPRFFRLPVSGEVGSGDVFVHPLDIEHVSNGFTARGPTVDNLAKFHEDWSSHFNPSSATAYAPSGHHEMKTLGVFAKYWEPGKVKTRLGREIGAENAARVYLGFLSTLIQRFSETGDRRTVVASPPSHRLEFENLVERVIGRPQHKWDFANQMGDDLGARLLNHTEAAFSQGASQLVLLGTDSPDLPRDYLNQAWQALETHDVVLGPADDGGYYLIGTHQSQPGLFENIPWSSPETLTATLEAAHRNALSVAQLPPWYDVDDGLSLRRLFEGLTERVQRLPKDIAERHPFVELQRLIALCLAPPTNTSTSPS